MAQTKIEWATHSWNPVTGCSPVSEGCNNCYAKRMANRLKGRCGYDKDNPFKVTLHPDRLDQPLRWKKPQMIFVCSMGDLFHDDVPDKYIIDCLSIMAEAWQHKFLLLTKRPERMKEIYCHDTVANDVWLQTTRGVNADPSPWPLPNVWLGVTAENQARADERIPVLLQIPAAVRFVSCEPLLSAIDLTKWLGGNNVNDGCGKTILCSNGDRSIQHFTNRRDLETQRADWECQGRESKMEGNPDAKSRNNAKSGPFKGSNDREWQESYGLCSSCSVDVLQQVRNPGCLGDKPQGWESEEQSPGQLRISNQEGEYPACGSSAKLTAQQVLEIRAIWKKREMSLSQIAAHYKVSVTTIQDICHRRTWKHLPEELTGA